MNRRNTLILLLVFMTGMMFGQKKKDILVTIDGKPVYASEFKRVYKKNLDLVQDESQKSVDGYMNLFIDYKLKVAEAYAQGIHENEVYVKEFSKYQEQLSRNYIYEDKFTEEVAKEAYDRGLEEINVTHLIIRSSYNDVPQDTLIAYNKIKNIRDQIIAGADFEEMTRKFSEEPGVEESGGNLGYFTVFNMVYPFETMAFNTPVGEVSKIVRTTFGYHILKINDRRVKEPEITVSHIMVSTRNQDSLFDAKERIQELYALLQQGSSFENVAEQYSQDKNSAKRGGKLNRFGKGRLRSPKFEEAAYSLKNVGDVSKPIESEFGYHIIRLDEVHPIRSFEERKEELSKRVKEGNRSKLVTAAINEQIKEKYGYTQGQPFQSFFETFVTDDVLKKEWEYQPLPDAQNKVIFSIGDRNVTYNDFAEYISERQHKKLVSRNKGQALKDFYVEFETIELNDYFKLKLEEENEEYAGIINEYRDGLLIFDVMNKNIWGKAKEDSLGLEAYYQKTKEKYQWKRRVDAAIFSATDNASAQEIATLISKGITSTEIKEKLNGEDVKVIISQGVFEEDWRELPKGLEIKEGISQIHKVNDSHVIVEIKEILPPGIKALEDVRGKVLSSYQNFFEETWMESLRAKYKVVINKKALRKVKKELNP